MTLKDIKDIQGRQNKILEIIVSSYVDTGSPVGSRFVSKIVGFSSATVRNVMSDLEEMGYITHPHTSAGRIPTDKGYRCYIESLMRIREINKKEAKRIEEEYHTRRKSIEEIIKRTAEVLSDITHHTGIVLFPKLKKSNFKHIELISIGKKKILVVLVTLTGVVKNLILDTQEEFKDDLRRISDLLNSEYDGLSLEEIKERLIKQARREMDSSYFMIRRTSELIESILAIYQNEELYLEGTSCLLAQPEFEDANAAKLMLKFIEDKAILLELMEKDIQADGIRIYIGKENKDPHMRNCSIVTSGYRLRDEMIGRLGIIGPTRMAYSYLIPLVDYISETVTRTLNEIAE